MKIETFYWAISNDGKIHSQFYALSEYDEARRKLVNMARANPGLKFHLMKRVTSCISSDLSFEDSE